MTRQARRLGAEKFRPLPDELRHLQRPYGRMEQRSGPGAPSFRNPPAPGSSYHTSPRDPFSLPLPRILRGIRNPIHSPDREVFGGEGARRLMGLCRLVWYDKRAGPGPADAPHPGRPLVAEVATP
jgi:hypothetical protein